jgi:putative ABC transport system permease protein
MANNLANRLIVNHAYFDAERAFLHGTVSQYFVATAAGAAPGEVTRRIDQLFANSSGETLSQTETAGLSALIRQVLDLDLIVKGVCGAALLSLLFLAGNTITQSAHERIAEFGVLKTLGYTDAQVSMLVLAESLIVFLIAAPVGLAIAWYLVASLESMMGPIRMPPAVAAWGLLLAVLSAVACALPPARRVSKLRIVHALANR